MYKFFCIASLLFSIAQANAQETSNREHMETLRQMFLDGGRISLSQTGKDLSGQDCTLAVTDSSSEIVVSLKTNKSYQRFNLNESASRSRGYNALWAAPDLYAALLIHEPADGSPLALVNLQLFSFKRDENSVTIRNQQASRKQLVDKKVVYEFTDREPESLTCKFNR